MYLSRFININMYMKNTKITYIIKRRKYLLMYERSRRSFFLTIVYFLVKKPPCLRNHLSNRKTVFPRNKISEWQKSGFLPNPVAKHMHSTNTIERRGIVSKLKRWERLNSSKSLSDFLPTYIPVFTSKIGGSPEP